MDFCSYYGIMSPSNSNVEVIAPNETIFGDRNLKEGMKFK